MQKNPRRWIVNQNGRISAPYEIDCHSAVLRSDRLAGERSFRRASCEDSDASRAPTFRGGGDEGGDGAVWGCVFTGTVPNRFTKQ